LISFVELFNALDAVIGLEEIISAIPAT